MKRLRSGYTTGACATAAAKGAALMLREQRLIGAVELTLPRGETAHFPLQGQVFSATEAACFVVKDAGDDPDITNGAKIHASVFFGPAEGAVPVTIFGGVGIGRVTKPGLAVAPGEWAINPVPRRMITDELLTIFPPHASRLTSHALPIIPHVTISIPNGELLAKKTLNARLGIIGGLSILGTTGIVRPISAQAWTDTIDAAIDVALACGCEAVVLSTGRTSELVVQRFLSSPLIQNAPFPLLGEGQGGLELSENTAFPEEAFVMMGDHVGHALRSCARKGVTRLILAGQFAKLLKIACGHEQTHVSSSELDLTTLAGWQELETSVLPLKTAVTARGVLEASGNDQELISIVCKRAQRFASALAPGVELKVLLAGYGGEVLYFA